ncbi:hypothetical protein IV102_02560 [bacterium]|nr:hypothetical protein [bacterium]
MSRQIQVSGKHGAISLTLFSEENIASHSPTCRSELRSKCRGVVLLSALVRSLLQERPFLPETGCYLCFGPGPVHAKTQQAMLEADETQRLDVLEKCLPPKDYFVANPAMKAAQIAIEFQLHGPWASFLSPTAGLQQACYYARQDLVSGQVPAALVGGFLGLDDTTDVLDTKESTLSECAIVHYATSPDHLADEPVAEGRYGPFTRMIGRLRLL